MLTAPLLLLLLLPTHLRSLGVKRLEAKSTARTTSASCCGSKFGTNARE